MDHNSRIKIAEIDNLPAIGTVEDVCRLTGKSRRTVQKMAARGDLPARKLGQRRWAFNMPALMAQLGFAE
jgi:excisionase family DNA binding protein